MDALGNAHLMIEEPDLATADDFVRRASSSRVAQARQRIVDARMEQYAGWQEQVTSPRFLAARDRAKAAMLAAFEERAAQASKREAL